MGGRKRREAREGRDAGPAPAASAEDASPPGSWWGTRAPVLKYLGVFLGFVVAFYAVTATPWFRGELFPAYLELNARLSAWLLGLLGEAATVKRFVVAGERFTLEVQRGCDAIEPSALYAAAVVAMPAPWRHKLLGLALGVPALLAFNMVRIVSLYYTGVYFPDAFEILHVDVWQPLFILIALLVWIAWTLWSLKRRAPAAAGHPAAAGSPEAA